MFDQTSLIFWAWMWKSWRHCSTTDRLMCGGSDDLATLAKLTLTKPVSIMKCSAHTHQGSKCKLQYPLEDFWQDIESRSMTLSLKDDTIFYWVRELLDKIVRDTIRHVWCSCVGLFSNMSQPVDNADTAWPCAHD